MVKKVDILAIGAHPDDIELSCGGTLAKLISEGKKWLLWILHKENWGQEELRKSRHQEATEAARILGVEYRDNLKLKDGFSKLRRVSAPNCGSYS